MGSDDDKKHYDKKQWQDEQAARDAALEKQRDKERKARERAARNAQRKLERLHRTLTENGDISSFEDEFGESVLERLDKFGAAFRDLEKGRPGDALSFAQKSVVAAMNKKVKALKKKPISTKAEDDFDDGYERTADRWKNQNTADKQAGKNKRSSFGSKNKPKFTPRVRHIDDDIIDGDMALDETHAPDLKNRAPYLPEYKLVENTPPAGSARASNVTPFNIQAIKADTEAVTAMVRRAKANELEDEKRS